MDFKLVEKKDIEPKREQWEDLKDALEAEAKKTNLSLWGFNYQQYVFYSVDHLIYDSPQAIRIFVGFRSRDRLKNPDKYGDGFRRKCYYTVMDKAAEILTDRDKYRVIKMQVREDLKPIEDRVYERQIDDRADCEATTPD